MGSVVRRATAGASAGRAWRAEPCIERWGVRAVEEAVDIQRTIEIANDGVRLVQRDPVYGDEVEREVELAPFLARVRDDIETPILPVGARWMVRRGNASVYVVEEPPRRRQIHWERFLLSVNLALPYTVFIVAVQQVGSGLRRVVDLRAFFRNSPIVSIDDALYHCTLPNTHRDGRYCWVETTEIAGQHYSTPGLVEAAIQLYWEGYFRDFMSFSGSWWTNTFVGWWLVSKLRPSWVLRVKWRRPQAGYETVREAVESVLAEMQGGATAATSQFEQLVDCMYRIREKQRVPALS